MTKKGKKRLLNEGETSETVQVINKNDEADKDLPKKKKLKTKADNVTVVKKQDVEVFKDTVNTEKLKKKKKKKARKDQKSDNSLTEPTSSVETTLREANDVTKSKSEKVVSFKKKKSHKKAEKTENSLTDQISLVKTTSEKVNDVAKAIGHRVISSKKKKSHKKAEKTVNSLTDQTSPVKTTPEEANDATKPKSDKVISSKKKKSHKKSNKSENSLISEEANDVTKPKGVKVISSKRKDMYKKKREITREQRKQLREQGIGPIFQINKMTLEEKKKKIAEIESRETISKTALRKLRALKKKVAAEDGSNINIKTESSNDKKKGEKRKNDSLEEIIKDFKKKKPNKDKPVKIETKSDNSIAKENDKASTTKKSKKEKKATKTDIENKLFIIDKVGSKALKNKKNINRYNNDKSEINRAKKVLQNIKGKSKQKGVKAKIQNSKSKKESDSEMEVDSDDEHVGFKAVNGSEQDSDKDDSEDENALLHDQDLKEQNTDEDDSEDEDESNEQEIKTPKKILKVKQEGAKEQDSVEDEDESDEQEIKLPKKTFKANQKVAKEQNSDEDESEGEDESDEQEISKSTKIIETKEKAKKISSDDELEEGEIRSDSETKSEEASSKEQTEEDKRVKGLKNEKKIKSKQIDSPAKKKRYVLFIGNIAYETTPVDLKKHFLTKVDKVADVRIPFKPGTRTPRGFAYIEVENSTDYEKALSLHGSSLNGRQIKVEYTTSGSKHAGRKQEIVHKNKKLHAMRKAGMLAGSKKKGKKQKSENKPIQDTA